MCEFLSAIGLKNGDVICDPSIDSHEDLVMLHGLKETKLRNWVRIEFTPEDGKYHLIEKYNLKIDDDILTWVNDSLKNKWTQKLKAKLKRLIITKNTHCLSSGTYILSGKILINRLLYCRVMYAGSSTIKYAGYSTIEDAGYSTIEDAGSSTIKYAGYSTIEYAGYSTIEDAGSSTIKKMNKNERKT